MANCLEDRELFQERSEKLRKVDSGVAQEPRFMMMEFDNLSTQSILANKRRKGVVESHSADV